ncbi:DUF1704 domain-containing protein [Candidatus Saccharibacteria bacterium]|nr:DUF1704 domain-containing protein [Candidatus Saccharibacteria bacterium]
MEKRNLVTTFSNLDCSDLDSILSRLAKVIPTLKVLSALQPTNVEEEREKWLNGRLESISYSENPNFEYDYSRYSMHRLATISSSLSEIEEDIKKLFPHSTARVPESHRNVEPCEILAGLALNQIQRARRRHSFLMKFCMYCDDPILASASRNTYGYPSSGLLHAAKRTLICAPYNLEPKEENIILRAEEIQKVFDWALDVYGLSDKYATTIVKGIPAIKTSSGTQNRKGTIKIPADRAVSPLEMKRLVAHELECHVLDRLNSKTIFRGLPRIGQELVSEGHALFSEEQVNRALCTWPVPLPFICYDKSLLYLGIQQAASGKSFNEIADGMANWYFVHTTMTYLEIQKKVWNNCLRIFRGCKDTKNTHNYAFTKDHVYLTGLELVARPLKQRGREIWLSTGLSSHGWIEYLIPQFSLNSHDLPFQNCKLSTSPELDDFIKNIA